MGKVEQFICEICGAITKYKIRWKGRKVCEICLDQLELEEWRKEYERELKKLD